MQPPLHDIEIPRRRQPQPQAPAPAPPRSRRRRRWVALAVVLLLASPLLLIALGRFLPVYVTSYMLQSPTRPVRHDWVPAERIAESARRAVVAAEDQKFWDHHGFDVEAMQKAYERNKRGGRVRGGSTISQQTAKNLFLWPGGGYFRKGLEASLTVVIEALWPKQRILEVYLNSAEFGPGIYGVEAAAQAFFGKPAAQLSAYEAARLAAVLPNPRKWKAAAPGPYVQSRAAWIQRQMGYAGRPAPDDDAEPLPPPGELPSEDDEDLAAPAAGADKSTAPADDAQQAPPADAAPEVPAAEALPPAQPAPEETPPAPAEQPIPVPVPAPDEPPPEPLPGG